VEFLVKRQIPVRRKKDLISLFLHFQEKEGGRPGENKKIKRESLVPLICLGRGLEGVPKKAAKYCRHAREGSAEALEKGE